MVQASDAAHSSVNLIVELLACQRAQFIDERATTWATLSRGRETNSG